MQSHLIICYSLLLTIGSSVVGQDDVNYDEALVPRFELPDALISRDGTSVTSAEQWWDGRRNEIYELFETRMYGRAPGRPEDLHCRVFEQSDDALDGKARRRQVTVFFGADESGPQMDMLIYLPSEATEPVPLFLGLNFLGNQTITDDPQVRLSTSWVRDRDDGTVAEHRATERSRGIASVRWPIDQILARGYGLAVIYYGDIDPDFDDGFKNGVHSIYHQQTSPVGDEWGSISAWAWGLSRALDCLESFDEIDVDRVAVLGHSRLGKTALWAGARDQRFAVVISNDSGCGGAALSRRRFGEKVERINTAFPHWFCDNFTEYNDKENELPFDQHMLIALMAPRPVLVCSAEDDRWADPRGEYLSARHAASVYRLVGQVGLEQDEMPSVNTLVGDRVGYHVRPGGHDMTSDDWKVYLDFADRFLKRRQ